MFRYPGTDQTATWTARPFVREHFAALPGCPASAVFAAVAERLGQGLDSGPENKPLEVALLDRYEQLIEALRLAGRAQVAFDLYGFGLGGFGHLGTVLGDYARGYRILRGFVPENGDLGCFGQGLASIGQALGLNALAMMSKGLGRLQEAWAARQEDDERTRRVDDPEQTSIGLQNKSEFALDLGQLPKARFAAQAALAQAERAESNDNRKYSPASAAHAAHQSGDPATAQTEFAAATALEDAPLLYANRGQQHARHALAQPDLATARAEAEDGLRQARLCGYRLKEIELLVTLSAIHLAWPDPAQALAAARQALDLATAPDCGYAWGEADAAQA